MAYRQYIGARYVTKIYENSQDPSSAEWEANVGYEPLVLVTYLNGSYLSKKTVPSTIGNPADNTSYWVQTGFYNGQVAQLQLEVSNINENLKSLNADIDLRCVRLGSADHIPSQAFVAFNNIYYVVGEDYTTGTLVINEIDSTTFAVITTHNFTETIHPNGAFIFGNDLYVVDSISHNIYVIDMGTFTISDIITTFNTRSIISGNTDENGVVYLKGAEGVDNTVYILDNNFNIDETIVLDLPWFAAHIVWQGIFVYDSIIYLVCNSPNILACFDFSGKCVGFKDIGNGDGFYPYGEVEFFTYDGTDILMAASPFCTVQGNSLSYFQVFKTNIINEVGSDSKYGQAYPSLDTCRVSAASPRPANPDGSGAAPFSSLYEAACVYMYNQDNKIFSGLTITKDCSLEYAAMCDCNISFNASNNIGNWTFKNCNVIIPRANFGDIVVQGGELYVDHCSGKSIDGSLMTGDLKAVTLSGALKLVNSTLNDTTLCSFGTVNLSSVYIGMHKQFSSAYITTDTDMALDAISKHLLKNDYRSKITLVLQTDSGGVISTTETALYLGVGGKNTINGGGTVTFDATTLHQGSEAFLLDTTVKILSDGSITLSKTSLKKLDGTAYATATALYAPFIKIEQF